MAQFDDCATKDAAATTGLLNTQHTNDVVLLPTLDHLGDSPQVGPHVAVTVNADFARVSDFSTTNGGSRILGFDRRVTEILNS